MGRSLSFEWEKGFIRVKYDRELIIEAENCRITLSQREIDIEGLFMNYTEHFMDKRGDKKVVYINFAFPLRGISKEKIKELIISNGDFSLGPFGISYTKLGGIGVYITFYLPPGFLYETAVLTRDKLALFTLGRRQIYVLDEGGGKKKILLI